jgi:hypothetical protein
MRPQLVAIVVFGAIAMIYLLSRLFGYQGPRIPVLPSTNILSGSGSKVVIVSAFKDAEHDPIREQVTKNREDYAKFHGKHSETIAVS